jgi:nitrilase
METICKAAADHKINVLLGFAENDGNSVYIAQCLIGTDGKIKMRRRKVKPTHMERTVFGDGSGNSLKNVAEVEGLGKVGALACWEHTQP